MEQHLIMTLQRSHYITLVIFYLIFYGSLCAAKSNGLTSKTPQLAPFVATYMVTAMGLEGINVTNSLSIENTKDGQKKYHFKSYSMPVGLLAFKKDETRNEQSEGRIINDSIQPDYYTYLQLRDGKIHRDVELKFNWHKKEVLNYHKHKHSRWLLAIPEQTFDKLSYQLLLMLKLAKQAKKEFSFHIADGGKLKEYHFKILGEERVYTSLGSYKAIKIQHHRYQKDKNIILWCAPELNFLPVKIIQKETGKPDFVSTLISYQEGMSDY